jgi:hypothetical protein
MSRHCEILSTTQFFESRACVVPPEIGRGRNKPVRHLEMQRARRTKPQRTVFELTRTTAVVRAIERPSKPSDSAEAQLERAARGPGRLGGRTSETAAPAFAPGYGFVSVVRGRWRRRSPTVTFLALAYGTAEERKERHSPSGLAPNFTGRHRCSQDSSVGSPVGFPQGNIHALNSSR